MVMAVPALLPLLQHAGIDLVHFGVVFVLNILIRTGGSSRANER
ncbi:MAG: hypothetical protein ACHQ7N_00645 [Candidatus Methylomirabilales bacterium]